MNKKKHKKKHAFHLVTLNMFQMGWGGLCILWCCKGDVFAKKDVIFWGEDWEVHKRNGWLMSVLK